MGSDQAHIAGRYDGPRTGIVEPVDFEWGGYLYAAGDPADHPGSSENYGDDRVWVSAEVDGPAIPTWVDATLPGNAIPTGDAYLPPGRTAVGNADDYMLGRFENKDTIVGLYVDPFDPERRSTGESEAPRHDGRDPLGPGDLPGRERGRHHHGRRTAMRT